MEIVSGVERRLRWRLEERLQIVTETEEPGARFAEVARRHDLSRGLLRNWRSQVRRGALAACPEPMFLPVQVMGAPVTDRPRPRLATVATAGKPIGFHNQIEITLADSKRWIQRSGIRCGSGIILCLGWGL